MMGDPKPDGGMQQTTRRKRKWDLAADDADANSHAPPVAQQEAANQAAIAAQKITQMIQQKQMEKKSGEESARPADDLDPLSFLQSAVVPLAASSASQSGATTSHRGQTPTGGLDIDAQAAAAQAQASAQSVQKFKSKFQDMTQECRQESDDTWTMVIDINDQRNRYLVTKSDNQKQITKDTGVSITTRGKYYPDRNLATEKDPPLHLRLVGPTEESVKNAHKRFKELLSYTINLTAPMQYERPQQQQRRILDERVPVNMEHIIGFPLRAKLVGPQGAFIKHITGETQSRIQLKGRGSGYKELDGMESSEPLYAHITCPTEEGLEKAKSLFQDLLNTVRAEYDRFRASNPYAAAQAGYGMPGMPPFGAPNPYGMMYGGTPPAGQPPQMGYYGQQQPYYGAGTMQPPPPPPSSAPPPPPDEDAPPPPPPDGNEAPPPPPTTESAPQSASAPQPPSTAQSASYTGYDPYGYYAQYYAQYYGYDYTKQQQQQQPAPPPPQDDNVPPPPPPE